MPHLNPSFIFAIIANELPSHRSKNFIYRRQWFCGGDHTTNLLVRIHVLSFINLRYKAAKLFSVLIAVKEFTVIFLKDLTKSHLKNVPELLQQYYCNFLSAVTIKINETNSSEISILWLLVGVDFKSIN